VHGSSDYFYFSRKKYYAKILWKGPSYCLIHSLWRFC
jgi:hypothetical protein